MIELGARYRDRITGFEGTATGFVTYITGCNQVLLAPAVGRDGASKDSLWFDEQRLTRTSTRPIVLENGSTPGPDRRPTRSSPPKR